MSFPGELYSFLYQDFFLTFGPYAGRVWKCLWAGAAVMLLTLTACLERRSQTRELPGRVTDVAFCITCALTLLLCRLPSLWLDELNPDESGWIVGAGTLFHDPRVWHSVDSATSGPLLVLPLTAIPLLHFSLNYASVRLFGILVCLIPTVYFIYAGLSSLYSRTVARLSVLCLVFYLSFARGKDTLAFNSEHIPLLLLSGSLYLLAWTVKNDHKATWLPLFTNGLLLGSIPYAKLQGMPLAAALAVSLIVSQLGRASDASRHVPLRRKIVFSRLFAFGAGLVSPSLVCLLYLNAFHLVPDFLQSYLKMNIAYAQTGFESQVPLAHRLWLLPRMLMHYEDVRYILLLAVLLVGSLCAIFAGRNIFAALRMRRFHCFLTVALVLAGYLAVVVPGNSFPHYLYLFMPPATVLFAYCVDLVLRVSPVEYHQGVRTSFLLLPMVAFSLSLSQGPVGVQVAAKGDLRHRQDKLVSVIQSKSRPGDRMAVWGWANNLYVHTGLIQGTRESAPYYQIVHGPLQEYYLPRYVGDLERNSPQIFVDAVAPGQFYFQEPRFRHENYPLIDTIISKRYDFVADVNGVRVYRRRPPRAVE